MARTVGPLWGHWPEYLIEAALLGTFMVAACVGSAVLNHPASPVARHVGGVGRRIIGGVLMGATAVGLICSPWGRQSGAHINPAVTLTFLLLGKIAVLDAVCYIAAQFVGAAVGVRLAAMGLGRVAAHPNVRFAATLPGTSGWGRAWMAEFTMSLVMMGMVLVTTNLAGWMRQTPLLAGGLVAVFIVLGGPVSGMSLNPARTLGSAVAARTYRGLWIYFTAPPLGMLCAGAVYVGVRGIDRVYCAKLDHGDGPCLFECRRAQMLGEQSNQRGGTGIEADNASKKP